jgi:S-(hydroxymethyl)glutathione dehydrogenase / alcohol dehydrogenase
MTVTRAAVLRTPGAPLEIEMLDLVPPGPGEVMVRLGATGICGTDYTNAQNQALRMPMVLGHEGAGVVEQVGDGVTRCAIGDHVVLSLISQCGVCRWCVNGQPHLCGPGTAAQRAGTLSDGRSRLRKNGDDVYQFLGLGTFSERIVVQQTGVVPIPRDVPLTIAALIGCGVLTGLGAALRVAPVPRGGTVLVVGCGGVGMNIIQGARIAGARHIVAVDRVPEKGAIARQLGATDFVAADGMPDAVARVTDGIGVDVAFDVVGSATTSRACMEATRRGGSICIVGSTPNTELAIHPIDDLIRGAKLLCGCNYGSSFVARDVAQAVSALATGALDLNSIISHKMRLDDINEGLDLIRTGGGLRTIIEY